MAKKKAKQTSKSNPKKAHAQTAGRKAAAPVRASAPPAGTVDESADKAPPAATALPAHADEAPPAATVPHGDADEAPPAATAPHGDADEAPPVATVPSSDASERDPRIPPVGTVIIKKDRRGAERARCTIVDGGVEYAGTIYKSLSGAGLQASKDLGNTTTTCDGLAFWGLKKVARSAARRNAAEALDKAWSRYRDRAATAAKIADAEQRAKVKEAIHQHATALLALAGEA